MRAEQLTLDAPFQKHSETSREAAEAIESKAPTLRDQVYRFITEFGPASDATIQEILRMDGSTERPRRVELLRAGLIRQEGTTVLPNGRRAALWVAT